MAIMKRLRDTVTIMEFALRATILLWQESKTAVCWKREYKQVTLSIIVFNHLSDDEIDEMI
jgi:hypothetical protein